MATTPRANCSHSGDQGLCLMLSLVGIVSQPLDTDGKGDDSENEQGTEHPCSSDNMPVTALHVLAYSDATCLLTFCKVSTLHAQATGPETVAPVVIAM